MKKRNYLRAKSVSGLCLLMLGIAFCANTYGQTNNLIEVDRDSLYNVFANYELLKIYTEKTETLNEQNKLLADQYKQRADNLERINTNYAGIVQRKDSIIASLEGINTLTKKNARKKARKSFFTGMGTGAAIISILLLL